jgi:macrolide transport system ATP-binding/permease protein
MVCQIAISLVMLVAAGLFVRTLSNLQSVELGFNRESVLLFQLNARKAGYKDPDIVAFYRDLRRHFSTIPACAPRVFRRVRSSAAKLGSHSA